MSWSRLRRKRKSAPEPAIPEDTDRNLVYGSAGPRGAGIAFRLSLSFRDETKDPPTSGRFEREWVVSRTELYRAELENRTDDVLLKARETEERAFLLHIERTLRRSRLRLVRVSHELVLRQAGE